MFPRLGIRSLNTATHAHPTSKFAKPHATRLPAAAGLSTTTVPHAPPAPSSSVAREPTPPQLPPRRRPQFAAAGFGLGGSHDVGKGKGGKGKTLGVPVAAVPVEGEDQVDGLQGGKAESNEAEACYVVCVSRPTAAQAHGPAATARNPALPPSQPPPTRLLPSSTSLLLDSLRNMGQTQRRRK